MAINVPVEIGDNVIKSKNGALRDKETGRFLPGGEVSTAIASPSQAREMVARKVERKRAILQEAALAAVERGDLIDKYGDEAWLAEIGYHMQKKATNIDDPKMVDAARFLLKETGHGEEQATQADPLATATEFLREMTSFARTVNLHATSDDIIEAE